MDLGVCAHCHMGCGWRVTVGAEREKNQVISVLQSHWEGLDSGNGSRDSKRGGAFQSVPCPFLPRIT